jgi:hypothetical protein
VRNLSKGPSSRPGYWRTPTTQPERGHASMRNSTAFAQRTLFACADHASACWANAGELDRGMPRCGHRPPVTCQLRAASADWPRLRLVRRRCRALPGPGSSAGRERLPNAGAVWLNRAWVALDSRSRPIQAFCDSNISAANDFPGSLTGSQRPQTRGYARLHPAIAETAKRHVRPHLAL